MATIVRVTAIVRNTTKDGNRNFRSILGRTFVQESEDTDPQPREVVLLTNDEDLMDTEGNRVRAPHKYAFNAFFALRASVDETGKARVDDRGNPRYELRFDNAVADAKAAKLAEQGKSGAEIRISSSRAPICIEVGGQSRDIHDHTESETETDADAEALAEALGSDK